MYDPMDTGGEDVVTTVPRRATKDQRDVRRQPRYNALLWDSDDHTFEYGEEMLRELFGHTRVQCQKIAKNGQEVIKKNQGATKKTITQITKLLTTA